MGGEPPGDVPTTYLIGGRSWAGREGTHLVLTCQAVPDWGEGAWEVGSGGFVVGVCAEGVGGVS